jgi:mRNA interferase MazF
MPRFEAWDIVKVPFPYIERSVRQHRPALVVAGDDAKDAPSLLWLAMITSAAHRRWPGDVPISDLSEAGLPIASIIRPAKLATIEARTAERLGRLPVADREAISRYLRDRLSAALGE